MAYLPVSHSRVGNEMEVVIRGRRFPTFTAKNPFYHRP